MAWNLPFYMVWNELVNTHRNTIRHGSGLNDQRRWRFLGIPITSISEVIPGFADRDTNQIFLLLPEKKADPFQLRSGIQHILILSESHNLPLSESHVSIFNISSLIGFPLYNMKIYDEYLHLSESHFRIFNIYGFMWNIWIYVIHRNLCETHILTFNIVSFSRNPRFNIQHWYTYPHLIP